MSGARPAAAAARRPSSLPPQKPKPSEKGLPAIARPGLEPKMEQPAHDAGLSKERTALMAKRSAKELLALRSDSFMTPMPDGVGKGVDEGVSPSGGEVAPKKHLAFEEELPRDSEGVLDRHDSSASEKAGTPRDKEKDALEPKKKAPSARTTATKVSPSLISKIENNESGCDLKITSLVPFDHLSQLCQALSKNTSTERLDLEGCGVGDKGCLLIRDLLINNKVIKHVDLQMNQVTDVGCRYLAEILPRNTTLHKLYLGYNDIRDDGVYALIGAMRPRGQLEVVVSGNTHVSEAALSRLDRALEQQWRSAPKQFKELKKELSVITGDSIVESPPPRTSARREERERNGEADEGVEAKRARRNDKIAMGRQETKYTLTLEEDVIRGPPFEFKLVSTVHHAETKALSPTQGGETGTTVKAQHDDDGQSRLRQIFNTRWERYRNVVWELLSQEARDLTLPRAEKSPFQTACHQLSTQLSAKSSMAAQRRLLNEESLHWQVAAQSGQLSEEARCQAVERRVHALLLKFRHMEEDMVRQQREDIVSSLILQPALAHPCDGQSGGDTVVPCPFRVQISLAHLPGILTT